MSAAPLTILVTGGAGFIGSALVHQSVGEMTGSDYGQYLASLCSLESVYLSDNVPALPRGSVGKGQK